MPRWVFSLPRIWCGSIAKENRSTRISAPPARHPCTWPCTRARRLKRSFTCTRRRYWLFSDPRKLSSRELRGEIHHWGSAHHPARYTHGNKAGTHGRGAKIPSDCDYQGSRHGCHRQRLARSISLNGFVGRGGALSIFQRKDRIASRQTIIGRWHNPNPCGHSPVSERSLPALLTGPHERIG